MESALYEKIGRQEVIIEALKRRSGELNELVNRFISGEEKVEDWQINDKGQLVKKAVSSTQPTKNKKSAK